MPEEEERRRRSSAALVPEKSESATVREMANMRHMLGGVGVLVCDGRIFLVFLAHRRVGFVIASFDFVPRTLNEVMVQVQLVLLRTRVPK